MNRYLKTSIVVTLFVLSFASCTRTEKGKEVFSYWTSDIDLLLGHIVEPTFHFNEWYTAYSAPSPVAYSILCDYFLQPYGYWQPVTMSEVSPDTWKITYDNSSDAIYHRNTSMLFHLVNAAFVYNGTWDTRLSDSVGSNNSFLNHTFTIEKPSGNDCMRLRCNDTDCQFDASIKADYLYYSILWNDEIILEGKGHYVHTEKSTGESVQIDFDIKDPIVMKTLEHNNSIHGQGPNFYWPEWWITDESSKIRFVSGTVNLMMRTEDGETTTVTVTVIDENHIKVR